MNPRKLRPYLLAEDIRFRKRNQEMYIMGAYVFDALCIALSNLSRKNGQQPIPYLKQPFEFPTLDEQAEMERERVKMEKMKAQFQAFADGLRKQLEEKENGR